jgi:hypothetical protein
MKPIRHDDRHPRRQDERGPGWVNRPENYGGYADSGNDDYPSAQQPRMRAYGGQARPRPSGEYPGDPADYARGYSRGHAPGWGDTP